MCVGAEIGVFKQVLAGRILVNVKRVICLSIYFIKNGEKQCHTDANNTHSAEKSSRPFLLPMEFATFIGFEQN